ncbi:MAG: sugar transferase [Clostridia bacterium]|nr:sugar transferase [Clostridia bacterium]
MKQKNTDVALGCYLFFKRVFDVLSSLLAIILLSPVLLVCLLVKWLEDFHNPLYISERVGKDGKTFKFFKIRTMRPDAQEITKQLVQDNLIEMNGPICRIKNDPRVTKFGKFLRRTSLDELPQLFNVLNGTMSVVGPRPPLPSEVEKYTQKEWERLQVKGGLLCLWQIEKNRNDLPFEKWLELDMEYIRKRSFWLDMKIILKGAWAVLFFSSGE